MRSAYILIAEDDEDDQFLLLSAFREVSQDFELIFVKNGIELLEYFTKFDQGIYNLLPSLLIVDLNMPKKNGKEAISELITRDYFTNFKTLVFSTTANEIEIQRCREMGINDFFVKPSNYNALLELVKEFTLRANLPLTKI